MSGFYGDGSDGVQTFDGIAVVLGIAPVANTYSLSRDIFLASATINSGVTINLNGFRLFCLGTLTNNGTISWNGASGLANGTAASPTQNPLSSFQPLTATQAPGGAGAAGNVGAGSAAPKIIQANFGSIGGNAGNGASAGGLAGGVTAASITSSPPRWLPFAILGRYFIGNSNGLSTFAGGTGGGGGGGDGVVKGGGGAAGGGIAIVSANVFAGVGAIQARGGNGGSPGAGANTGGGGAGGGGVVIVASSSVVAGAIAGQTIDANGGIGGTGFGAGTNGSNGSPGLVVVLNQP